MIAVLLELQTDPERALALGAEYLLRGKLVAFPTETVYGLGANAWDAAAVARIFQAKGRPADNPLIAHVAGVDMLAGLIDELTPAAERLIAAFWPGPLSLVLPRHPDVSDLVTAGLPTVAVRWPAHPVAEALIRRAGVPVAAPSANRSGRPSPTTAAHVESDLGEQVDLIIDAGPVSVGLESTVVDVSRAQPVLLRPGAVTLEELTQVIGPLQVASGGSAGPAPSPGMKYRHYAPEAPLTLFRGPAAAVIAAMSEQAANWRAAGQRVGVLTYDQYRGQFPDCDIVLSLGDYCRPQEAAQRLYSCLREFDRLGVQAILAQGLDSDAGLGLALHNRLHKAAGQRVIAVPGR